MLHDGRRVMCDVHGPISPPPWAWIGLPASGQQACSQRGARLQTRLAVDASRQRQLAIRHVWCSRAGVDVDSEKMRARGTRAARDSRR
jgi:hypothetical protein